MSTHEHDEDARIEELVRETPLPAARPEFVAELRARFVAGDLAPTPRPRPLRADRRRWRTERRTARRGPWALVAALSAAAAIVLFVTWDRFGSPGPTWRAVAAERTELFVDGAPLALSEAGSDLPADALGVRVGDDPVRLVWSDDVVLECAPGTRIDLVRAPRTGGTGARRFDLALHAGELRVATGPGFDGSELAVRMRDALVDVAGTQFLVEIRDDSTCVCVREGVVGLTVGGERREVGKLTMHLVLRESGAVEPGEPTARHAEVLGDLATFWRR